MMLRLPGWKHTATKKFNKNCSVRDRFPSHRKNISNGGCHLSIIGLVERHRVKGDDGVVLLRFSAVDFCFQLGLDLFFAVRKGVGEGYVENEIDMTGAFGHAEIVDVQSWVDGLQAA